MAIPWVHMAIPWVHRTFEDSICSVAHSTMFTIWDLCDYVASKLTTAARDLEVKQWALPTLEKIVVAHKLYKFANKKKGHSCSSHTP